MLILILQHFRILKFLARQPLAAGVPWELLRRMRLAERVAGIPGVQGVRPAAFTRVRAPRELLSLGCLDLTLVLFPFGQYIQGVVEKTDTPPPS